jgi:hypothetical protein
MECRGSPGGEGVRGVLARLVGRDRGIDPFETLELQSRLGRLAAELERLDHGADRRFARGHHLRAALEAYERTLDDACALAGLSVESGRGPAHRLLAETALHERGWWW